MDDDPFSRMLYQQHLQNLGYKNSMLFDNGIDCINKLDMQPDVIFLDYDMQPFNGLEILQTVKKQNPNIPILIISSEKDAKVAKDATLYGAECFIPKGERDLEMISKVLKKLLTDYEC